MILKNAVIHVGDGDVFLGDMRVSAGKIVELGKALSGDEERDLSGMELFPGFIDSGNFLGAQDMAYFAKDYNENSHPVTPYLDIWHSLDPDEISLQELYKAGITSMVASPGNEGVLGGTCAVVKTCGRNINALTVRRDAALKVSFTSEVIRVFRDKGGPKTPMAMAVLLREALARTEYGPDYRSQRTREVMDAVRSGKMPVLAACETAAEMERFFEVTAPYPDMKIILTLSYEADRVREAIQERGAAVVLGDTSRNSVQLARRIDFAQLTEMAKSGTKFGLTLLGPDSPWGRETLLWNASKLMRTCQNSETVLQMLTANPADLFGVSKRIGRLQAGLDADYLVYRGNPMEKCGAQLLETVIDGKTVYQA